MMARYAVAALLGAVVTFGLFLLMQALISMEGSGLGEEGRGHVIEFVRLKRDSDLNTKNRKRPDKQKPEEPPPPPPMNLSQAQRPDQEMSGIAGGFEFDLDLSGPNLGSALIDTDIIPLVRVNPQYPIRASERGIEGWVEVEFTITAAGTVRDPLVIASHPSSVFNRAALRAIRKWKYNPKIDDGVAVERPGVRVRLTFELEDT